MVWDANCHYSRSYYLSQNTFAKVQIQSSIAKKFKSKKSKPKDLKPAKGKTSVLLCTNEPEKTSCQDKKKKYRKKKQEQKNSISAIRNNAIEGEKKRNN